MRAPHTQHRILSLSIASAFALGACGGSDSTGGKETQGGPQGVEQGETLRKAQAAGSQIVVMARGSLAANWGPMMQIRVNGQLLGSVEVRSQDYQAYVFSSPALLANGSRVEVSFINDGLVAGVDRNLYVQSITVDGKRFAATAPEVRYVRGWDEIAGQEDMLWNGTLRLAYSGNQALTVRARGTPAAGQGPVMDVQVNGASIAKVEVTSAQYDDYTFNLPSPLPLDSKLDLVFANDTTVGTEDRNLYIESIRVNGVEQKSTAPGVTYDRGAVDGVDVIPGQASMLWNGALRFGLSAPVPPPGNRNGDTPPAGYSLCAVEGQVCSISGTAQVVYGANSTWSAPRPATGSIPCDNTTFGDTVPTVVKACYAKPDIAPPPPSNDPFFIDYTKIPAGNPGVSTPRLGTHGPLETSDTGDFRVECSYSHMNRDDPIVFPNQPGRSHLHIFFGNSGINANTNLNTLADSGNSNCWGGSLNRSGYWMPAVVDTRSGQPLVPSFVMAYYKTGYEVPQGTIRSVPTGLRMISGNSSASDSTEDSRLRITCDGVFYASDYPGGRYPQSFPTCPSSSAYVEVHVPFPQCWVGNGVLDSPNHKDHMAYPVNGACPPSHPIAIPHITILARYDLKEGGAEAFRYWRMSSDRYDRSKPGGFSSHADWVNGWDPATMETFIRYCDNGRKNCTNGQLGDGRAMVGF